MTSAELYDPNTERWTFTYPMSTNRSSQTATLLPNGKVLIAGGSDWNNSIYTAEMYDPATEMWAMTGPLNPVFTYRNATLLPNGKVLATGLHANYGEFPDQANAELFDPVSQSWADLGDMNVMRGYGFTETLLPSGQVLFTGGDGTNNALSSAELFDLAGQGNVPTPPALGITTYNSQPTVFFPMATGANYVLQMTTDLASGNWVTVSNGIPISGLIITNPPDNAFFRLK